MERSSSDINVLGPWVWNYMGNEEFDAHGKTALGGINEDGSVRWGVVYDHYNPGGSIQMHVGIDDPKCVTRRAIQSVFEYPFYQLGVKKVLATVNSENHAALTFDFRLGFQVEALIEDAYDRGDMYILSMTQEQCRWLRGKKHGKCKQSARAA